MTQKNIKKIQKEIIKGLNDISSCFDLEYQLIDKFISELEWKFENSKEYNPKTIRELFSVINKNTYDILFEKLDSTDVIYYGDADNYIYNDLKIKNIKKELRNSGMEDESALACYLLHENVDGVISNKMYEIENNINSK